MAKKSKDSIKAIPLSKITLDKGLQPRLDITQEAVVEYAEAMQNGETMPPCLVVWDSNTYWLCDGFHRIAAAKTLKFKTIECEIINGTRIDAMWLAAAANLKHGVRRTNADKRRAVQMAIICKPEGSLRDIAIHCAVTHEFVRNIKQQEEAVRELNTVAEIVIADAFDDGVLEEQDDQAGIQMIGAEAAIKITIKSIDDAIVSVNALLATKYAAFVSQQRVLTDLKNAKTALRQSLPHEVCPLCDGEKCETCRLSGWVTKQQWELIPKEQRGS